MRKFLTWMSLITIMSLPTAIFAQDSLSTCLDKYRHSKNRDTYCYGQITKNAIAKSKKRYEQSYEKNKAAFEQEEKKTREEQQRRFQQVQTQEEQQVSLPPAVVPTKETQTVRPIRQQQVRPRRSPPSQEESPSTIPYY